MKKIFVALLLASAIAVSSVRADDAVSPPQRGGLVAGLYGCCFGLRGAIAYNDGKDVIAMEWIDGILTAHIWAFLQGYKGTNTADMRKVYGESFF